MIKWCPKAQPSNYEAHPFLQRSTVQETNGLYGISVPGSIPVEQVHSSVCLIQTGQCILHKVNQKR